MIVDDVAINVKLVRAQLALAGFRDFVTTTDAMQTLELMESDRPDIVLLDIMMPNIRGDGRFKHLPVLILTSTESRELRQKALHLGATDFLAKPINAEELVPRVRNALLVKAYQDDLERRVRERTRELERAHEELVYCLARAAEFRDHDTGQHVIRVGRLVGIVAQQLGFSPDRVRMLSLAATLHDLGKIGIPDAILTKTRQLSPDEIELVHRHCGIGRKICSTLTAEDRLLFSSHVGVGARIVAGCTSALLELAARIALTHHERWDGTGYPLGLAGEAIPIEGRITAVADVFDALSNRRPYKAALPVFECFQIIEEGRGKHFDPQVLDAFLACKDDVLDVHIDYSDA
jgi:putative two-component system response regulator